MEKPIKLTRVVLGGAMNIIMAEDTRVFVVIMHSMRALGVQPDKVITHKPPPGGWTDRTDAEKHDPFYEVYIANNVIYETILGIVTNIKRHKH